ncbi:alpha/beta fold hydrolase [Streptomyces sp. NBC_01264]|uniref:alpha/beta fold hydrolase n=1 Tax=Streptomyces sp. NBC_01264 TaxID=2903804 RepID=UPI00225AD2E6|nr:alpha/beta hydrolase [Streptomyces sp. NBC_01264]MCX4778764.1 alpha/beta hydrolase [Streptomyces sp. NBC_01264]
MIERPRQWWTHSGVRLRRASQRPGRWNWLFVPGGPGLGSESLAGLVRTAAVPGTAWLLDLPGDGSNTDPPTTPRDPYALWPAVLTEAAEALPEVVVVGHSTGGMFALSTPALEPHLAGLVLIESAPHSGWQSAFAAHALAHPLPGVAEAATAYAHTPSDATLRALTLAAAPWNFTPASLTAGRALLEALPYNNAATTWASAHFDDTYRARWAPRTLPTLIISGTDDHVVDQSLWRTAPSFNGPHILHRLISAAGHFPWLDAPQAVRAAFTEFEKGL